MAPKSRKTLTTLTGVNSPANFRTMIAKFRIIHFYDMLLGNCVVTATEDRANKILNWLAPKSTSSVFEMDLMVNPSTADLIESMAVHDSDGPKIYKFQNFKNFENLQIHKVGENEWVWEKSKSCLAGLQRFFPGLLLIAGGNPSRQIAGAWIAKESVIIPDWPGRQGEKPNDWPDAIRFAG